MGFSTGVQNDDDADGTSYDITIYEGVVNRVTRTAAFKISYDEWPSYRYDYTVTLNADADYMSGTYNQFSSGSESGTYEATKD